MPTSRVWVAAGLGVALAGVITASVFLGGGETQTGVYQQDVVAHDLRAEVSAIGTIEARRSVKVGSEVAGKLESIGVEAGAAVQTGQELARIDAESVAADVERLEAEVRLQRFAIEGAGLALAQATRDRTRTDALATRQVLSDVDADGARLRVQTADVELRQARERLRQSEAMLRQSRENLSKTRVAAPLDGVVTAVYLKQGEGVIPGLTNTAGTVILEVADLTEIQALCDVVENEIPRIQKGQPATVEVDALSDRVFQAIVIEVALQGQQASGDVARFPVRLRIQQPDAALRPGMSARVRIVTDTRLQAVAIPIQAVVKRDLPKGAAETPPATGKAGAPAATPPSPGPAAPAGSPPPVKGEDAATTRDVVYAVRDGKAAEVPVTLGISTDTEVEILAGLKAGDRIVTGPYRTLKELKDGAAVKDTTAEAEADRKKADEADKR